MTKKDKKALTSENKKRTPQKRVAIHRRQFLKSACAGVGMAAVSSQLEMMNKMRSVMAQTGGGGYKALVCVFLEGGNDSSNLLIPTGGELRDQYVEGRGILALTSGLHALSPTNTTQQFGLNPNCGGLADLFNAGNLSFLANVGMLAYPFSSREEYRDGLVPRPLQLFSHSDQQVQWQTGIADQAFRTGWGGKVATALDPLNGSGDRIPMAVSVDGTSSFLIGDTVSQYVLNANGVSSLDGYGTSYSGAVNADGTYRLDRDQGRRLSMLDEIASIARDDDQDLFAGEHARVYGRARDAEAKVSAALAEATAAETGGAFSFDDLFTAAGATDDLGNQLKMVARLIAGRAATGNTRQIFFVRYGGFDTHQAQLGAHAPLMAELSAAFKGFWDSLNAIGMQDAVTTFTSSEFNRTFSPNGTNSSAGADHAWGGHAMVMGGGVDGRKIFGAFPSLVVGSEMDVDSSRGRFFPTTSVEQYSAVLANWFGVDSGGLEVIFPNLSRFDDPFGAGANLRLFG